MNEMEEKRDQLAREILILSRNTLLVNLRFLDVALSQFNYVAIQKSTLLTDGKNIFYYPSHILKNYKYDKQIPVRDYLHIVFHCIFRHMYMEPSLNRSYWDLACDIAVENVINELGLESVSTKRQDEQKVHIKKLKNKLNLFTAEKIYHYLMDRKMEPNEVEDLRCLFYADNHEIWYKTSAEIETMFALTSIDKISSEESSGSKNGNDRKKFHNLNNTESSTLNTTDSFRYEMSQIWKDISEQIQVDMETFGRNQGYGGEHLTQNLLEINREKYDYTEFLKKFAVMGEIMKINDDEFDYIFYTYGLNIYENVPLIEPLEYKEVKRIKEFVIAIDTSGSTSVNLVQKFVQKTYNILKSAESFFSRVNIHIIQCDAELQEDVKITCQEEFDDYLKNMKIHGLGGTDFRPVFSYVESLKKKHEFTNLKGLIYFTDGMGEFPNRKPDYETAFVYIEDEYNNPSVPPWAIKIVLQRDEI